MSTSLTQENWRKVVIGSEIQRPSPLGILAGVGSGVTPAAVACTCVCGEGPWAEQTHRLACRAPAACTGRRQRSWRWRRSGSPATEPSGPVTKLDPLDHLQPVSGAHWAHGGLGGVKVRPCSPSDRAADPELSCKSSAGSRCGAGDPARRSRRGDINAQGHI